MKYSDIPSILALTDYSVNDGDALVQIKRVTDHTGRVKKFDYGCGIQVFPAKYLTLQISF